MNEARVIKWAEDRGIFEKGSRWSQAEKTEEELRELFFGIGHDNRHEVRDAIGDIIVTLIIQAHMWDLSLAECYDAAWNEIKDRQGTMIDGTFVKEVF